ncbi:MAG: exodeoxyribonuclease I [Gammaproteobacteria bacterium]|nr:exodeoxyribonuclease I [Gammaproteobacteria bacterium]
MAYQPDQTQSILWHDYETFGIDPRFDRPVQFAAIRTDLDFNPIGEPMMWYCRPADDYLPSPGACMVTGITPQRAMQEGLPEVEFMARINAVMSEPGTCVVGYNNLRFDDEFTRYGLYRNCFDAYAREWQGGNSRWDLLDLVRGASVLRPEGINWPRNEAQELVLKLDQLAPANGIEHGDAHDALADVWATIALAKKLREAQPRLYNFAFQMKHKAQVWGQLDLQMHKPVLHIAGMYGRQKGYMALVAAMAKHPSNNNGVLVFDLRQDPKQWFDASVDELKLALFSRQQELGDKPRLPVQEVHVNKCPFVAPMNTLAEETGRQYGVERQTSIDHLRCLQANPAFVDRVVEAYRQRQPMPVGDVDGALYGGGFFDDHDKRMMQQVHATAPQQWGSSAFAFHDERLPRLLMRMKGRSYPEQLNTAESAQWEIFRHQRLLAGEPQGVRTFEQFGAELNQLAQEHADPQSQSLLQELATYAESIYPY